METTFTSSTYSSNGSMGRPPKFDSTNFDMWKGRMLLFLESTDSHILEIIRNGPHIPLTFLTSTPIDPPAAIDEPC